MMRTRFLVMMSSIIVAWSMSLPVKAWVAAGARGVAVGGYGAGCYHGAYYRAAPAWGHSAGVAYGPHGGSAAWSHGSGSATSASGSTAAWSGGSGSYHAAYGG